METWLKHAKGNNSVNILLNQAKSQVFTNDRLLFLQ